MTTERRLSERAVVLSVLDALRNADNEELANRVESAIIDQEMTHLAICTELADLDEQIFRIAPAYHPSPVA